MNHFKLKPNMRAMSTEQTLDKETLPKNEKSSFTPFSCHTDSHVFLSETPSTKESKH